MAQSNDAPITVSKIQALMALPTFTTQAEIRGA